jgi:hypothetical protein
MDMLALARVFMLSVYGDVVMRTFLMGVIPLVIAEVPGVWATPMLPGIFRDA